MTDESPRVTVVRQLVTWVTGIHTLWQVVIFVLLGAAVLAGTLLYQHPEWVTLVLEARYGEVGHE